MAGFRMHVSTSALLGCGYAAAGHAAFDVPLDTSILAGAMCGVAGMLPDLDSDNGVPLRETMAFTAAVVPMLLVARFQTLALSHDGMALVAVGMYLFVRFGITNIIRKYTVHRGMFHSIPAGLVFAGLAFIVSGAAPLEIRLYKAGGVMAGFMSHLVLDEIYAVEWKSGRWRLKKSFGTALKFWGDDAWSNFSTYAKLVIVTMVILAEPSVMERIESRHPQFAEQYRQFQDQVNALTPVPAQDALQATRDSLAQPGFWPSGSVPQSPPTELTPSQPPAYRNDFNTAQWPPNTAAQ